MGRKGVSTDGEERAGHIAYEIGISGALSVFQEAERSAGPKIPILAELTFLQQEFQFCNTVDAITRSSLKAAIQSFDDAGRVSAH
jgi:hypothetical protein